MLCGVAKRRIRIGNRIKSTRFHRLHCPKLRVRSWSTVPSGLHRFSERGKWKVERRRERGGKSEKPRLAGVQKNVRNRWYRKKTMLIRATRRRPVPAVCVVRAWGRCGSGPPRVYRETRREVASAFTSPGAPRRTAPHSSVPSAAPEPSSARAVQLPSGVRSARGHGDRAGPSIQSVPL